MRSTNDVADEDGRHARNMYWPGGPTRKSYLFVLLFALVAHDLSWDSETILTDSKLPTSNNFTTNPEVFPYPPSYM